MTTSQDQVDRRLVLRLNHFAAWTAVVSMIVAASVLLGWKFQIATLTAWFPGLASMRPNAALCFLLAGGALWMLRQNESLPISRPQRLIAQLAAILVTVTGTLALLEDLFGWRLGIDRLLFATRPNEAAGGLRPGLIPAIPAFDFILLGLALLLLDWKSKRGIWLSQWLAFAALTAGLFGLLDFLPKSDGSHTPLALPGALLLFALSLGVICSRSQWAFGGLLVRETAAAGLVRNTVPGALLALTLSAWALSRAIRAHISLTWVEFAAVAVTAALLLGVLVLWTRRVFQSADRIAQEEHPNAVAGTRVLQRMLSFALALAIFLIGFTGLLSWRTAQKAAEDSDWVVHSAVVSTTLELTLRHLLDVETGARGFALTGRSTFLEPYLSGRQALSQDLPALRVLILANPGQQQRMNLLDRQTAARIGLAQGIVATRREKGTVSIETLELGKQIMDATRVTIEEFEADEKTLLKQRVERAQAERHFTASAIALSAVLGMIFLLIAGAIVKRQIGLSAAAQAEVSALNAELERRAVQRTAALRSEVSVRLEAEAQLRASEETFRLLLDGIKDYAIYMLDPEGCVVSWNSAAAHMQGYQAEEIIGKHFSCFSTAEDRDAGHPQNALRVSAGGGRFEEQAWRVRQDSSRFWANTIITPLYAATAGLRGYSAVVRDITEQMHAENTLKNQAALLDLANDAIIMRDMQGRIVFWNRGAQRTYGWSREEAIGAVTHDLFQTKFPLPLAGIHEILLDKGDWQGELLHQTGRGVQIVMACHWSLQRDEHGKAAAILEINRDISDRKRVEDELRESQERLAGIIGSAMDAIISVDSQQRILLFNSAAEKIFLCPAAEVLGQPLSRFIPQRFQQAHAAHFRNFDGSGVTSRAIRSMGALWAVRANGEEFQIEASVSQVETGGTKLFTVILRDVTARLREQEELRQSNATRRLAVEATRLGEWQIDLVTGQATHSLRHDEIFGYSSLQTAWNFEIFISHVHPEDRDSVRSSFETFVHQGGLLEIECRIIWSSGEVRWILARGDRYQDLSGKDSLLFGSVEDITEQKAIIETLKDSEEDLRLLLQGAKDYAVYMLDVEGRVATWNEGAARMKGYSHEEVLGKPMAIFYTPEQRAMALPEAAVREAIDKGRCEQSGPRLRRDGSQFWAHMVIVPLYDSSAKLRGFSKVLHDISARKLAEDALLASEEKFQTLANCIPQLAWMAEGDGNIFWYNQRWFDYTGTTLQDMSGWGWQTVHHPATLPDVMQRWKRAIDLGEPFEMIFPLRAADGSFHPFLTRIVPSCDHRGKVTRWFGTNTDITGQRQIEDTLRENQERLRLAQEVAQIGTFEWNHQTGEKRRTPELAAMFGLLADEFPVSQDFRLDLLHVGDRQRVQVQIERSMETGEFETEWRAIWPNGEQRWHFARARVVRDEAGVALRTIGAVIDITERKLAELEVRSMNTVLEQRVEDRTAELTSANKELAAFAYSVSHDLRAPLRGIDGWSLALLEDYGAQLDPGAHKYLDSVRSETQRMGHLIDDMLLLSRVTRDDMRLDAVDLTRLAEAITGRLRQDHEDRQLEFVLAPGLMAAGDARLIEIALTNLLSNAVKFTGKRNSARIEFGRSEKDGEMTFYIRDNGAGFDMAYAGTLFGAFQRLHKFSDFPGSGIGLAIVSRVVGRHHGRIWAEAQVNCGATFWFTLEPKHEFG